MNPCWYVAYQTLGRAQMGYGDVEMVGTKGIPFYYMDTDEKPGFFLLLKNHIFIAHSEDTILSFMCEDIGVAMVTNMISQLQESFLLRRAASSFDISSVLINRTLHGCLGIWILSSCAVRDTFSIRR